jgi:hypothetical protein
MCGSAREGGHQCDCWELGEGGRLERHWELGVTLPIHCPKPTDPLAPFTAGGRATLEQLNRAGTHRSSRSPDRVAEKYDSASRICVGPATEEYPAYLQPHHGRRGMAHGACSDVMRAPATRGSRRGPWASSRRPRGSTNRA